MAHGDKMRHIDEDYDISEDEKIWGFIAWLIPLVGALLVLILKPNYKYARHWANLSISFFIIIIIAWVVSNLMSFLPFLGWIVSRLIGLVILVTWILGMVKSLEKTWWSPLIIYDIARYLGIESK